MSAETDGVRGGEEAAEVSKVFWLVLIWSETLCVQERGGLSDEYGDSAEDQAGTADPQSERAGERSD